MHEWNEYESEVHLFGKKEVSGQCWQPVGKVSKSRWSKSEMFIKTSPTV